MTEPPWKVGELARRTGLSVRALHHYDAIGLLQPSLRTAAGHRLYGRADVERLQQIQSLRLLGVPLDEVRRLLDDGALSPRAVSDAQLRRLRERIAAQAKLAERLSALADHMDRAEDASLEDLCRIIEAMTRMERHFTPDQLAQLEARRAQVGEQRIREVQQEWAVLIPEVQAAMDRGADPTSPEVLALARRWKGLVEEFTGGDAGIEAGVRRVYAAEGERIRTQHGKAVPTPEMFEYVGRALAALR